MPTSDSYNKLIAVLQNAKPTLSNPAELTNVILLEIQKDTVNKQRSNVYYLFRNVTVSAAAMLTAVFLYQTFLIDEKTPHSNQDISINIAAPGRQPAINEENLVQSLMAYLQEQKTARGKYKKQVEDYTLNLINQR
jgi:hypothetical protein